MRIKQGYHNNKKGWYKVYERFLSEKADGNLEVKEVCVVYVEPVNDEWVLVVGNEKGIAKKYFRIPGNVRLEFVIRGGIWEYYREVWVWRIIKE